MPCYSISRAHLNKEVERIEATGERVTSVVPDGATIIVVTVKANEWRGYETRGGAA